MSAPPQRSYKQASVLEAPAGFGIALDQRSLTTPGGADFRVPTRALGEACAQEFAAQGERIIVATMPLTEISFVAIDETPHRRAVFAQQVAKYGETDLVCHRAATPKALAKRQSEAWDDLVVWAEIDLGLTLPVVTGVIAADVAAGSLEKLRALTLAFDDFRLTALAHAVELAGSAVIALALTRGRIDGETAFRAATIDESWSLEQWGDDNQARARLDKTRADFATLTRFLAALQS